MRKTSQDGGDATSITSGIENELKKVSNTKTKRNSIKKKVQNFGNESDDGVIEPLLQKDKDKTETINQSAKYLPFKTDSEKPIQKNLKAADVKVLTTQSSFGVKDTTSLKSPTSNIAPIHNHMNTNVFINQDNFKAVVPSQSQILVEIDGKKPVTYTPSPLIFTTAKIHTDGKTKQMEPVQVTSVPILSTLESSGVKSGVTTSVDKSKGLPTVSGLNEVKTFEKLHKNGNPISVANIKTEKVGNNIISNSQTVLNNKLTSIVAVSQPLTQEVKTIKTLNSEKNQKSVENEPSLVSSVIKTDSGIIPKTLQSDLSYSSSSTETLKSKLPTLTSKEQCNVISNTPKNVSSSKADDKAINKETSKVQESQMSSNKHGKNSSSVASYKAIKQISLDNTNLPTNGREPIDNIDKEKINKLTSNRQLHRQKKSDIDESDIKLLPATKDVSVLHSVVKSSKDSAQLAMLNIEQESNVKDTKIVQQNDKPKTLKSDINPSEIRASANKTIKKPISTTTANQPPLNSSGTKQPIATGSIVVSASPVPQSSNIATISKNKSSKPIEPVTTTVSLFSKSGNADVHENTNVKAVASNSKSKTESAAMSKISSNLASKSYEPKTSNTPLPKTTTSSVTPTTMSKTSNNTNASIIAMTTLSNTTRPNINSVSLPKTTNASSSMAVKSSGITATSAVTISQNKKNGKKSVDNNDAKGLKA
ncbi:hypothetical protein K1T71_005016 [Dendrolimus kikuchii]|uniref:Uncharacterized protein n=1 Tax=Dendrolimus kikuchii TaxID=765133 RepID=A0ACC1D6F2_9NEOP|nr:hypothetical protein K1T71_005016 [Dendrolimus kikuchii]